VKLVDRIKKHEGYRELPYRDNKGVLTIGYGTNLDIGLNEDEATLLLGYRLNKAREQMFTLFTSIELGKLNNEQIEVLTEVVYWLGIGTFSKFKKTIQAIKDEDYKKASEELMDSKAGREFPTRMSDIASRILKG